MISKGTVMALVTSLPHVLAAVGWEFSVGYSQAGLPFADGRTGFLVWGGTNTLNVTVSRADLWDHRGGYEWTTNQTYANIRDLLQSRNPKGLEDLFRKEVGPGEVRNPYMLPLGMVRFDLGDWNLLTGSLDSKTGVGELAWLQLLISSQFGDKRPLNIVPQNGKKHKANTA